MARKDKPPLGEHEIETGRVSLCVFLIHVMAWSLFVKIVRKLPSTVTASHKSFQWKTATRNLETLDPTSLPYLYTICSPALTYHSNNAWNAHVSTRPHPWKPRQLCPCLSSPSATAARHLSEVRKGV